jgi:hypothetical protein
LADDTAWNAGVLTKTMEVFGALILSPLFGGQRLDPGSWKPIPDGSSSLIVLYELTVKNLL